MDRNLEYCKICAIPRTRVDYLVGACSSCKAFYLRSVALRANYTCFLGGKCSTEVKRLNVARCKACRFRRYVELVQKAEDRELSAQTLPSISRQTTPFNGDNEFMGNCDVTADQQLPPSILSFNIYQSVVDPYVVLPPNSDDYVSDDCDGTYGDQYSPRSIIPANGHYSSNLFASFDFDRHISLIDRRNLEIISTFLKVASTAEDVFFVNHIDVVPKAIINKLDNTATITRDDLIAATQQSGLNFITALQKFLAHLPAAGSRPTEAAKRCFWSSWKMLVLSTIHSAMQPVCTNERTLVSYGGQSKQCTKLGDIFDDWPLMKFIETFKDKLRKIGLDFVESSLLLALVLFEPINDDFSEESVRIKSVHRHYGDVLLDVLQRRSSEPGQFSFTVTQLGELFSMMQLAHTFCTITVRHVPQNAVQAHVTIIEAEVSLSAQDHLSHIIR